MQGMFYIRIEEDMKPRRTKIRERSGWRCRGEGSEQGLDESCAADGRGGGGRGYPRCACKVDASSTCVRGDGLRIHPLTQET